MLERILLTVTATFALNLVVGAYVFSEPQAASQLHQQQTAYQPASRVQNNYSLNVLPNKPAN